MFHNATQISSMNSHKFKGAGINNLFYLEDVSVSFGKIPALKNIKLNVEQGEILFITGVSGAGKSTLLKLMAGMITPDSGKIFLPEGLGKKAFVSHIFQDLRLNDKKTCEENLFTAYDKTIYQNKNDFYQEVMEFSRILGIRDRLGVKAANANGGLRQKIAFIRSMLTKPDILLADEPTCSLDFENAKRIYDVLNYYNVKKNLTVIWASHNSDLVKRFSGRIVHLDNNKLVYSGHACFI